MKRQYNPPPTYGGSRFIRATHGVRGLEDNEFATKGEPWRSQPQPPRSVHRTQYRERKRDMPDGTGLLPDFEYYTNMPADIGANGADTQSGDGYNTRFVESDQSREKRYMADEEYRDTTAPVDRIGHDYDMNATGFWQTGDGDRTADGSSGELSAGGSAHWSGSFIDGGGTWDAPPDGTYMSDTGNIGDAKDTCTFCGDGAPDGCGCDNDGTSDSGHGTEDGIFQGYSGHAGHSRRPMRRRGMFRADRALGRHRIGHVPAMPDESCAPCAAPCEEQNPHPFPNLSIEDGDLLLLVILALLAGEDGCADLVATLALLLMVR